MTLAKAIENLRKGEKAARELAISAKLKGKYFVYIDWTLIAMACKGEINYLQEIIDRR